MTLDDTQPQEVVHQNKSRWFSDFGTNFASILGGSIRESSFNMNSTIDFGFFFSKWAGCLCICVYMIYIYI